ncbi:DUF3159 domain-containing protein [Planctomonas psychrotolerans]|uniref:DUF3159 domain-containing protein n=1 Tax=Planctomonas psychrotolerans TaxID=2528712 RepID=UPI00123C4134|nr:DUF3159 domain-containing protein [Planctomonas psychrotolerans]
MERTLERIGGPIGLASAAAPTIAFVVTDLAAGLAPAIIALALAAVAACVLRLARRESPAAAVAGLVVAAICATVAALAGEARAFFLPSMVLPVLFVVAYTVSLVARRPLMGLIVNPLSGAPRGWRTHRPLRRLYTASTLVGMGLAVVNLAIRIVFYTADQPGALAVVQVTSTTVFALHFAVTVVLARRIAGASGSSATTLLRNDPAFPPIR